ncbi:hypothetical protein GQ43DRAFT_22486 [Delitschia confertaspora ATCC 74209]|uniref:Zn(2)-C6 fungal-type domain-containing protein n=1 Tax=Delitschia confertaspora ATCC 74209 TaxID=1513339 RepID=A0A9P4JLZ9_9PLEO|nr:hypothetical protein GQ43DRAFT_22486 [Delitschia confertaspora ATCC 74209]
MGPREGPASTPGASDTTQPVNKPKRVRTGCLTCRERHLKCDEAMPTCQNCRKSNRTCKRGIRLNFIDTQCQAPPISAPMTQQWQVEILDESRDIASEYQGGLGRYSNYGPGDTARTPRTESSNTMAFGFSAPMPPPTSTAPQPLPPIQGILPEPFPPDQSNLMYQHYREPTQYGNRSHTEPAYSATLTGPSTTPSAYGSAEQPGSATPKEPRNYLDSQEEVFIMQVFVEEVGLWMDSLDPMKHFSELLPFHALVEPMLLNAFLACGARHLSLIDPKYSENKALNYYDKATDYLLRSLADPNRDTVICATTAVILNVYEIMSEKALQRMNHIAGARALIKECGWSARSTGIGAACFWLNVGMELLSCLHFNWQVAWDPDEWGVDLDFARETESGREDKWTYRIVYIVAKVANFRASIPLKPDSSPQTEHIRLQNRYAEWKQLKSWADTWNENIPRTMHPMGFLYPDQTRTGSAFPEVWYINRTTVVARLFYHTCMTLLAQINPVQGPEMPEMAQMQQEHSQLICGIVAHVKDRGVCSVALRSLAIAAECLPTRREQEEVLNIFNRIRHETGWRVGFLYATLKEKWGWGLEQNGASDVLHVLGNMPYPQYQQSPATTLPSAPPMQSRPPVGIPNPLLATADFGLPQHPYQSYYVAPNSSVSVMGQNAMQNPNAMQSQNGMQNPNAMQSQTAMQNPNAMQSQNAMQNPNAMQNASAMQNPNTMPGHANYP